MKRQIENKLYAMLADKSRNNVIIVEGARQVGKSFMVNHVLQSQHLPLSYEYILNAAYK